MFHYRFTFGFIAKSGRTYLIQFSIKDMWSVPDFHIVNYHIHLYGWLFLYFGYTDILK